MNNSPEEKVGAKQAPDAPFDITKLDFVTPTEIVDLPSRGEFYAEDHPLHGQDSIEIRFMTAKDEDILTSQSLIKKGVVIDRLLQNLIIDKRIKPDDLLVGDKNAIIVAARISGYGPSYDTKMTCPSCGSTEDYSFDLGECLNTEADGPTVIGEASKTESGTYLIELPKSQVKAEVRVLTGADERYLAQLSEKQKKHKLPESFLTNQLRRIIVALNGIDDPSVINKFIDVMPAMDSLYLRDVYNKITPNAELRQEYSCITCGHEGIVEVPFTVDFFWPKR